MNCNDNLWTRTLLCYCCAESESASYSGESNYCRVIQHFIPEFTRTKIALYQTWDMVNKGGRWMRQLECWIRNLVIYRLRVRAPKLAKSIPVSLNKTLNPYYSSLPSCNLGTVGRCESCRTMCSTNNSVEYIHGGSVEMRMNSIKGCVRCPEDRVIIVPSLSCILDVNSNYYKL